MTERRRLPDRVVAGFHQTWAFYSPAEYDDRAWKRAVPVERPRSGGTEDRRMRHGSGRSRWRRRDLEAKGPSSRAM
jgi:hypothetical protein